ncbi:methylenetetrahydrofolate reductase [uncultured Phascolarctobacterium sp.]|jgi:methylenetetrahydrofolate reductase (NADPH)|uniref:methylenetetrahydrofolate reductase n=1 Tax=uncultured Phascolarctobacterium sp. TaxID=512296 RepID=UPI0025F97A6B|nr:methylenetetrahydrofolate reductase [uncultured Phascolarctobacterium sp.]
MHNKKIIEILNDGRIHLSCELFPPKQGAELQNSLEIVNRIAAVKPSYMSVTYGAGGSTVGYSAALAKEVQDNGLPALAHLTCVKADEVKITEVLQQLQGHGVNNILALRGDIPADMQGDHKGSFAHASDLMRFIKEQGDFCVGGAAYPEGHPESGSLEKDIENTKYKVEAGVDFLVTQMFFDNTILYNYMFRLLRAGINVPVVPGIMPVTNAKQIIRICQLSGTKLPPQFRAMVEKFADKPEALKQAGIAYATGQIIDLISNGFDNVHIYTMNKPEIFKGIMDNLSEIVD